MSSMKHVTRTGIETMKADGIKWIVVLPQSQYSGTVGKVWGGPEVGWTADVGKARDFETEESAWTYLRTVVYKTGHFEADVVTVDRFRAVTGNLYGSDWARFVLAAESEGYTVRRNDKCYALADEDGCTVLELPVSVPVEYANLSLSSLGSAYRRGFDAGQEETRTDIRKALGL